jgi:hypothetical protein
MDMLDEVNMPHLESLRLTTVRRKWWTKMDRKMTVKTMMGRKMTTRTKRWSRLRLMEKNRREEEPTTTQRYKMQPCVGLWPPWVGFGLRHQSNREAILAAHRR